MIKFVAAAAMAAELLSPLGAGAQTPLPSPGSLPPYGRGIGLDIAKKMLDAAEAAARKNGWQEAIAVVDSGGRLVAFFRMDNTRLASIDIAIGKAVTANNVKRPTKALQDSVAPGSSTPRMQGLPGITPVDGGLPILIDGKVVGAIGAAGAAANQDAEVAAAGLAAATAK
ncbi:MAG TPA: heme-binding protein [Reyranella sp.]